MSDSYFDLPSRIEDDFAEIDRLDEDDGEIHMTAAYLKKIKAI